MPDVAIIGGGAIGLAAAWRAAGRGLSVTVFDPTAGSGATHAAAGMLAPVGEAQFGEERLLRLTLESWRMYPGFVAELEEASGLATGHVRCGSLLVARDGDERAALEREWAFRRDLGLEVQRLTGREARAVEPRLAPGTRGGLLAGGDDQIDPRALVSALVAACEHVEVRVVRDRVVEVLKAHDRVTGVHCAREGRCDASMVVLAAGAWSADIAGAHAAAVVRPVKGQILRLRTASGAALCEHIIRGRDAYIVPRPDGRVVIGATVEERGFETSITAGAVHGLLRDASELVPEVLELELLEAGAGLRPGSPDNAPLLGAASDGLILATGHHRNGILLTPITAEAVAAIASGAAPPAVVDAFSPSRFDVAHAVTA